MNDLFWIRQLESDRYLLLMRDTHFCLSCGRLDSVTKALKKIVLKYKTEYSLLTALSYLESGQRVSSATFEQRSEYYLEKGHDFNDLINTIISSAKVELKENSPYNRTKKRLGKVFKKTPITVVEQVKEKVQEEMPKKVFGIGKKKVKKIQVLPRA